MTTSLTEDPNSREVGFSPPSLLTKWTCEGESDQNIVSNLFLSGTPMTVTHPDGILHRYNAKIREEGHQLYKAAIEYGPLTLVGVAGGGAGGNGPLGSWYLSFDSTGGSIHITHSKETIAKYPVGSAPDFKQLIGVNNDQVDGTEIIIPAMKITAHFKHPAGLVALPRIKQIGEITGMVSSTPFLTFAAGETLFLGAIGTEGSDVPCEVQYQFAMSKNKTNITVGAVTGIAKNGWECAWVRYKDTTEVVGAVTYPVKVPEFVYVERVYETIDLASVLGFG